MKWVDYREKLGIGFNDNEKLQMLRNKLNHIFSFICDHDIYDFDNYKRYAMMVGEPLLSPSPCGGLQLSIVKENSMVAVISKIVAICNSYSNNTTRHSRISKSDLLSVFENQLQSLNIPYEILQEEDDYFIFPKGAKELDDALVSQPLEWLNKYPLSHKAFIKALKDYGSATEDTASEVADSLRKALETFFQEFFGGSKSLENYKSGYGGFLKDHGIPTELANNFQTLLDSYTNYNNNYAKHHDKTSMNALEYLLYQTGNIIRLLITLKNGEKT